MNRPSAMKLIANALALALSSASATAAEEPTGRLSQPLTGVQSTFWPSASIPVCWDTWNAGEAQARNWVREAIGATWERFSAVRTAGWASCAGFPQASDAIRIRVDDVRPVSQLGTRTRGVEGGMVLNFAFSAWTGGVDPTTGNSVEMCADGGNIPDGFAGSGIATHREYCIRIIAVHEFGHALGFAHEDHRTERFGCNEPHTPQGPAGDRNITAYDLESVMNYCNPNWNGHGNLSFHDRVGVVATYGGWSPDFAITPNNAAARMTYVAAAHRSSGELHAFYQGPDRAIGTNWSSLDSENGLWQKPFGITPPGAARADTPIAAVSRGEQLHVFFIGADNALATVRKTGGGNWAAPFPITPPRAARDDSPLAVAVRGDEIHVLYIGPDGAVASTWAAPNVESERWRTPFPITPPGAAGPTSRIDAVVRDKQLHVFYQGADRAIASTSSEPNVDSGRWRTPFPIAPSGAGEAGTEISAVLKGDQLHAFYQGPDGALAETWAAPNADGGRWRSPSPITPPRAGRARSAIAALARNADKLDVHYIGPDGAVATVWADTRLQNGRWQAPFPVTPPGFARENAALTAASRFGRMMDVFYVGRLHELKTLWSSDPRGN